MVALFQYAHRTVERRQNLPIGKLIGIDFTVLYADDAILLFETDAALRVGLPALFRHMLSFAIEPHYAPAGSDPTVSKTVALHFHTIARTSGQPEPPLPPPIIIPQISIGSTSRPGGTVPFVRRTVYLGGVLNSFLDDHDDVDRRIDAASKAFGAMRCVFATPGLKTSAKAEMYVVCVLSVLLYLSELGCVCF